MIKLCQLHLHDRIISLRGEVWVHKTSLTPPLCVFWGIDFPIEFWNCSDTVYIFVFHFIEISQIEFSSVNQNIKGFIQIDTSS